MSKKALVVVSFGTSHSDTRKKTIEICENELRKSFLEYDFFRAWTSKMIIKKIKNRDNEEILFPDELMDMLCKKGYDEVYIQSLHLICGEEYNKLLDIINSYKKRFSKICIGRPLLSTLEDYKYIAEFIDIKSKKDIENDFKKEYSAVVWMGHGTEHIAHSSYAALDYRLRVKESPAFIGTVEGYPEIEDVLFFLEKNNIKKVHLRPLLLVSGDHAKNDMAGNNDKSWKKILEKKGFEIEVHLEGIGQFDEIQRKFVENLKDEL